MGKITVTRTKIEAHRITCSVTVKGDVREAFTKGKFSFYLDSDRSLGDVPESIAVIPLLGDLLPVAWVYDAVIEVGACDRDFAESIPAVKQGYADMYPMLCFGGELHAERITENTASGKGALALYSGGADSADTAIRHLSEKPALLSIWGSDIPLSNAEAWAGMVGQIETAADALGLGFETLSSNFRSFLKGAVLNRKVAAAGDDWWHGFQHGLALLCQAAPMAWLLGTDKVYIASSFSEADRGKYTCASDPTIDNHVRYCGAQVIHDGYDCIRQDKLHNIVQWHRSTGKALPLHVCWEAGDNSNCCHCEKCWRTILGLYAEGEDPRDYGFAYEDPEALLTEIRENGNKLLFRFSNRYLPILRRLREHYTEQTLRPELKWLWDMDVGGAEELLSWVEKQDQEDRKTRKELTWQLAAERKKAKDLRSKNDSLRRDLESIRTSRSYRLGRLLSRPLRVLKSWTFHKKIAETYWRLYGKCHKGWKKGYASYMLRRVRDRKIWEREKQLLISDLKKDHPQTLRRGRVPAGRVLDFWLCYAYLGALAETNYLHFLFLQNGWPFRVKSVTNLRTWFSSDYLNEPEAKKLTEDKVRSAEYWADWYRRECLPVSAGRHVTAEDLLRLAEKSGRVIVKPNDDYGGHGIFVLEVPDRQAAQTAAARLNVLQEAHIAEPYLQQTGVLHELNPSSLNTLRIVTGRHKDGSISVDDSYLRIGHAGSVVDNISSGGMGFMVDFTTGRLWEARDYKGLCYEVHPDTGRKISGMQVPRWQEAVDFVISAHRAAPAGLIQVGWDVCICEDEMYMIEVNCNPGQNTPVPWNRNPWKATVALMEEKDANG